MQNYFFVLFQNYIGTPTQHEHKKESLGNQLKIPIYILYRIKRIIKTIFEKRDIQGVCTEIVVSGKKGYGLWHSWLSRKKQGSDTVHTRACM